MYRGKKTFYLKTPTILSEVRSYFACPNAIGGQLENEGEPGSLGSHWE
jgi:hypothetical protein